MLHNGISIAQDPSLVSNDEDTSDWTFMLGAGTSYGPSYIGSNKLKAEAFSLVLLEYKDLFYVRGPAVGFNFLSMAGLKMSVASRYQMYGDRSAKDNQELRELEAIDAGIDLGLVASLDLQPWSIELSMFKDVSGTHKGALIELGADRAFVLTDKLQAEIGVKSVWGDRKVKQAYFGITPAQSTTSGFRQHSVSAGLVSAGLGLGVRYLVNPNWHLLGKFDVDLLLGDAADSPIVKETGNARCQVPAGYKRAS